MSALGEREQISVVERSRSSLSEAGQNVFGSLMRGGLCTNLVVAALLGILSILLVVVEVPLIGPAISLVGVSILPGWLFAIALFGVAQGLHPVTWMVLTFGLSTVVMVLDALVLTLVGIPLSRNSMTLAGVAGSLALISILALRQRALVNSQSRIQLGVLLVSILVVCGAGGLVLGHQPVEQESYTEFYVVAQSVGETAGYVSKSDLALASHEDELRVFRVICSDSSGIDRLVTESRLGPDSVLNIGLLVPPPPSGSRSKITLSVYRDGDVVPYRWIELVGGGCDLGMDEH